MKKQNYNFRKCIIKNKKLPKTNLIRVYIKNNLLVIDDGKVHSGRGYYISKELDKIDDVKLKNILEKKLHITISNDILQELKK